MSSAIDPRQSIHLVRFILDRIDEDEAELKQLARDPANNNITNTPDRGVRSARRQRAEVEAKRRLLASLQRLIVLRDQPMEKDVRDQAVLMLRALAEPYSDHHGYPAEWHLSTQPH